MSNTNTSKALTRREGLINIRTAKTNLNLNKNDIGDKNECIFQLTKIENMKIYWLKN